MMKINFLAFYDVRIDVDATVYAMSNCGDFQLSRGRLAAGIVEHTILICWRL